MEIALDAMGGDHAPGPIVAGALKALEADPELRVTLVGDETAIRSLMGGSPPPVLPFFIAPKSSEWMKAQHPASGGNQTIPLPGVGNCSPKEKLAEL